jgi:hypothetical protein
MSEKEETLKEYTVEEASKHTSQDDCWLVIGNQSNGTSMLDFVGDLTCVLAA